MSVLSTMSDALGKWFSFGGGLSNDEEGPQSTGPTTNATSSGISVGDEKALGLSAVWACCDKITNSVVSMPIAWYRRTPDGRELLESSHYLSRLFLLRPNRFMKTRDFRKAMTFQLAFWNNAYAKIDRDGKDRPIAITPLDPKRMTPNRDDSGLTYHYATANGVHVFADKSILHMKGMTPDGVIGLERIAYARETLGISASADRYASKQFANGGRAGGVLTVDTFLTAEQRTQLAKIYEGMSATADNANKLWVLEGGTDYKLTDFEPDKMQMLGTREHQLSEAARYYGVPAVLIDAGDKGGAWPASFERHVLAFLTFTLQGYLDEWEASLIDALVPLEDMRTIFLDHDVESFIRMDSAAKAEYRSKMIFSGQRTINEMRKKDNYPPIEGGDKSIVQVNMTTTENLPLEGQSNVTE